MRYLFVSAGVAALLASAGSPSASAHALLRSAIPPVGSTVTTPPTVVTCIYSEELEPSFSTIEVQDAAGHRVDANDLHLAPNDGKRASVSVPHLGAGTYSVIWHVTSVDTHRTQGHFRFTVTP